MAKKKVNRKKQLRREFAKLRKLEGATSNQVTKEEKKATQTVKPVVEKVKETTPKASFEAFSEELSEIPTSRLETFYAEGIQSVSDFSNWTEKDLLALKGIGPATIKQLKEAGLAFKN